MPDNIDDPPTRQPAMTRPRIPVGLNRIASQPNHYASMIPAN